MSGNNKYKGLTPFPPDVGGDYAPVAKVVEDQCIACERCIPVCFFDALAMEPRPDHDFGATAVVLFPNCTGCGLCFEACPVDAIIWIPDIM
jgi:formate hydrogenlyase subunit 6/NADH:ubiquinone oxidoreductase subunit I